VSSAQSTIKNSSPSTPVFPPNVLDQRPRAKDARNATAARSRGSLYPACSSQGANENYCQQAGEAQDTCWYVGLEKKRRASQQLTQADQEQKIPSCEEGIAAEGQSQTEHSNSRSGDK
jgi:hypothetical protein